jgi:hypothetical protein
MFLMHHAFRRDLQAFAEAAAATPLQDRVTWRRLEGRWRSFARILHYHHAGEDEHLWPLLLERVDAAGDTAGRATLEAMEAEHGEIDPLLSRCAEGFARLAETADADARAALVVRVTATRERLGAHLGHEERDAMPLVQRSLTPQEWRALDKEFAKEYSPGDVVFTLPWVLHAVPAEAWPRVREFLGAPMVGLWRLVLRGPFERRERQAFRYAVSMRPGGRRRGRRPPATAGCPARATAAARPRPRSSGRRARRNPAPHRRLGARGASRLEDPAQCRHISVQRGRTAAGGASPHNRSTRVSVGITRSGVRTRAASSARCLCGPRSISAPSRTTRTGPRTAIRIAAV